MCGGNLTRYEGDSGHGGQGSQGAAAIDGAALVVLPEQCHHLAPLGGLLHEEIKLQYSA